MQFKPRNVYTGKGAVSLGINWDDFSSKGHINLLLDAQHKHYEEIKQQIEHVALSIAVEAKMRYLGVEPTGLLINLHIPSRNKGIVATVPRIERFALSLSASRPGFEVHRKTTTFFNGNWKKAVSLMR